MRLNTQNNEIIQDCSAWAVLFYLIRKRCYTMNVICIGDVVGKSGVEMVAGQLRYLKQDYDADFVIVNGENAANGLGIDRWSADTLIDAGVDVITTGNHAFSKKQFLSFLKKNTL